MKTATDIAELIVIEADHGEGIYPIVTGARLIKAHAIKFADYFSSVLPQPDDSEPLYDEWTNNKANG